MKEYLKSQSKLNTSIINNLFSDDEILRFSKADYRWTDKHSKPFLCRSVKKGEIYQFEFGKNYKPEMSYEHRGLVIGIKQKLLYVLPIFSYLPSKHLDVYHPVDNPRSKSNLFLLKNAEFSFITHDSVLKLNDLRTVSTHRIIYQHKGTIATSSDTYKTIEQLVIQKYFPSFLYNYKQLEQKFLDNQETMKALASENQELKQMLSELLENKNSALQVSR